MLQELLELAQRKFLRQVIQYADAMETSPFPRLFVLDFLSDEEKDSLKTAERADQQPDKPNDEQCPLASAEADDAAASVEVFPDFSVFFFFVLQADKYPLVIVVGPRKTKSRNAVVVVAIVAFRSFECGRATCCLHCWPLRPFHLCIFVFIYSQLKQYF